MRDAANIQPPPSAVCVLVAPPLGRARVWAAFRLPAAWLRTVGWNCDFLACHRGRWSYSKYARRMGMPSRTAYQRLVRSGARVKARARWRDLEGAVLDPNVRAIILIGHHAKDGVELLDGVTPTHVLMALLERRNASGPFPFAWLVCSAQDRGTPIVSVAPDVLPFSAPMRLELPAAIESAAAWIEGLNGETPFDLAQQRAFARQFPSERPRDARDPRDPS